MFEKINVAKELHAIAKSNATSVVLDGESMLKSVTADFENRDAETLKMLELFATSKQVNEIKSKVQASKRVLTEEYVTFSDIRDVCIKYNLRFLPVRMYAKPVPFTALDDLRKFKESFLLVESFPEEVRKEIYYERQKAERDGSTNSWGRTITRPMNAQGLASRQVFDPQRLVMIAPADHFTTIHEPVRQDPVILYDLGNSQYKVVTKFGNDFTWMRRISGFVEDSPTLIFFMILIIISALAAIVVYNHTTKDEMDGWGILACVILVLSVVGNLVNLIERSGKNPLRDTWNTTTGIKNS